MRKCQVFRSLSPETPFVLIIPWSCVRITPGLLSLLAPFRRSSRHLAQVPSPHGLRATVAKRCDWGRLPAASANASCARRLLRRAFRSRPRPLRSGRPGLGWSAVLLLDGAALRGISTRCQRVQICRDGHGDSIQGVEHVVLASVKGFRRGFDLGKCENC